MGREEKKTKTSKKWSHYTFAFYNVENLFDLVDDPDKADDDFTAKGFKKWSSKRLQKKISNLGAIIQQIGLNEVGFSPVLVGLAEVESASVLKQLISSEFLKDKEYDFVHFESSDERGIDTALLYRKKHFKILEKKAYPMFFLNEKGDKDYTRDILYVKGLLENKEVYVLINHWPSRRAGLLETEPKREAVSLKNQQIVVKIRQQDPAARIIVMGDFNDDPQNKSVQSLATNDFYNPMELLLTKDKDSLKYKGKWNLFDQILISQNFLQQYGNSFRFENVSIFNDRVIQVFDRPYEGRPFRTYAGPKYLGGTSDHFPVYAVFKIEK
jgi:hypothetical protein